ncbi:hypothetical protein [Dactylosporangium sp. CA-092794]
MIMENTWFGRRELHDHGEFWSPMPGAAEVKGIEASPEGDTM